MNSHDLINLCSRLDLTPIPLIRRSKRPLVKFANGAWKPTSAELDYCASKPGINWGILCGPELFVLDFDDPADYQNFITSHPVPTDAPIVKSTRGYHIWLKSKQPVATQYLAGVEIKGTGAYIVAPPSVSATGHQYKFLRPPNGHIPEVDIQKFLGLKLSTDHRRGQSNKIPEPTNNDQIEFRELFAQIGIHPGKNPSWCPWHPDREGHPGSQPRESLSIDWDRCLFKCHSPRCSKQGGLARLKAMVIDGYGLEQEDDACQSYPITTPAIKNNSDIPIPDPPPWDVLNRVDPPLNRCGYPIYLRHRGRPELQCIMNALCHQWNCAICGPYLKEKWRNHLTPIIRAAREIYFSVMSVEAWPTVYRRINRSKANYVRIELPDGQFALFTTAKEGISLPNSIRDGVLRVVIDAATFDHKAITTSREWKLLEKVGDSEWERIIGLDITIEEAKEVIEKFGLEPTSANPRWHNGEQGFNFTIPSSWLDNDELGFKRLLLWLQHGPSSKKDKPDKG